NTILLCIVHTHSVCFGYPTRHRNDRNSHTIIQRIPCLPLRLITSISLIFYCFLPTYQIKGELYMYIKTFEHITYEEVEGVLNSLDAKLNNESQLQSLAGSSQNGPSMHDAKSSLVNIFFNDIWIEYIIKS